MRLARAEDPLEVLGGNTDADPKWRKRACGVEEGCLAAARQLCLIFLARV